MEELDGSTTGNQITINRVCDGHALAASPCGEAGGLSDVYPYSARSHSEFMNSSQVFTSLLLTTERRSSHRLASWIPNNPTVDVDHIMPRRAPFDLYLLLHLRHTYHLLSGRSLHHVGREGLPSHTRRGNNGGECARAEADSVYFTLAQRNRAGFSTEVTAKSTPYLRSRFSGTLGREQLRRIRQFLRSHPPKRKGVLREENALDSPK